MVSSQDAHDLADAARLLAEEHTLEETLQRVVDIATELTDAEGSGLLLYDAEQHLGPAAATDEAVEMADQIQESLDEGPGLSAGRAHRCYLVRDTGTDLRWPRWGPIVADLGITSVLSACVYTKDRTIGTLNLYSSHADALAERDAERARLLASHAAVAIDTAQEEAGLRLAIETRNLIGQAQGLLMERYGLSARQAFDLLRQHAERSNITLRAAAEQLVQNRNLLDPH
ncbi:GAF and ANTAR domain-containing protein [Phytoactinopolyspora alkaliphila]|uniref:GAF and ANTAR domain-containing protein n=1 Tax=Phytoactinopolyspora alkaliphila TaxID=1783498 RepID=A0A6N9YM14_9ACTN|nr:GAF and ANTAR domain-containing protein [Phytoactinopolyspora alkaliphila]NED95960.1 GAF and ANTAR domain-containing protein [Phytoactinopolyspora alkaliphila]